MRTHCAAPLARERRDARLVTDASEHTRPPRDLTGSAPARPPHRPISFPATSGGAHDFKVVDMGSARGRVPLAARVKRVLDALHSASRPLRWLEVYELAGVDVRERELFGVLKAHDKVFFDEVDKRFTYKTKYDCRSKAELLLVLRGAPEGLPLADLKDCYKGVLEDVESLKEEGEIYVLTNNETRAQVAFPTRGQTDARVSSCALALRARRGAALSVRGLTADARPHACVPWHRC